MASIFYDIFILELVLLEANLCNLFLCMIITEILYIDKLASVILELQYDLQEIMMITMMTDIFMRSVNLRGVVENTSAEEAREERHL